MNRGLSVLPDSRNNWVRLFSDFLIAQLSDIHVNECPPHVSCIVQEDKLIPAAPERSDVRFKFRFLAVRGRVCKWALVLFSWANRSNVLYAARRICRFISLAVRTDLTMNATAPLLHSRLSVVTLNNMTPRIEPCGTPPLTSNSLLQDDPTLTVSEESCH